jgi:hypothetical protein
MTVMSSHLCERSLHNKQTLLVDSDSTLRNSKKGLLLSTWKTLLVAVSLVLLFHEGYSILLDYTASTEGLCPQASELLPHKNAKIFGNLTQLYRTETYKTRAISWLSGAVRIPYDLAPHCVFLVDLLILRC